MASCGFVCFSLSLLVLCSCVWADPAEAVVLVGVPSLV
jgi:hypothetical protein